ncbi:MAG: hypothetical protein IPL63_11035 [Saprospiraceae bacterium]|nr:hypothetical protein [Saprospiraceae bacterium]
MQKRCRCIHGNEVSGFTLDGLQDKYVFDEADTTILLPFTFNDNQIYEIDIDVVVGSGTTATEDEDFALGSHTVLQFLP